MREVERRVVLSVLDRKWREHLYEMDYLQEGIGLRAMAQRDPLIEYQREGFQLFEAMMDAIKEESVSNIFSVQVEVTPPAQQVGATPMAVGDLVGGVAQAVAAEAPAAEAPAAAARGGAAPAGAGRTRAAVAANVSGAGGRSDGVKVSGVDLATPEQRSSALRYTAPGEDGRAVETGQQPVERKADRRGKKVKRRRR